MLFLKKLLFIMIFLVPTQTLDNGLLNLSAVFWDSRTIFIRRYLLQPGLRITIAGALVLMQADVTLLAYGYLLSGVLGVAYYAWAVVRQLQQREGVAPRLGDDPIPHALVQRTADGQRQQFPRVFPAIYHLPGKQHGFEDC